MNRGYRDAVPMLQRLGINVKMPELLQMGGRQLSTEAANGTRLVTKLRWIVEARNSLMKLLFKFLDHVIPTSQLPNLKDFLLIFGGIRK